MVYNEKLIQEMLEDEDFQNLDIEEVLEVLDFLNEE